MLDPDMPAQALRLHMGEMTAQELRTARAAIRWANTHVLDEIEIYRLIKKSGARGHADIAKAIATALGTRVTK